MNDQQPKSSMPTKRTSRRTLSSGIALGALIVSVPVAAMLLTDQEDETRPATLEAATPTAERAKVQDSLRLEEAVPRAPTEAVVAEWERLLNEDESVALPEITAFLSAYPEFPRSGRLRVRGTDLAEAALYTPEALAFFRVSDPVSPRARFLFAQALRAGGEESEARAVMREAWRDGGLSLEQQEEALSSFGMALRPEDHAQRVDRLLWDGELDRATALVPLLPAADRALAESRIALQSGSARGGDTDRARALVGNVPESMRRDPGLIYDQYKFARATGNPGYARELLASTRIAPGSAGDPDKWMEAHLEAAGAALNDNNPQLAYRIAAHHGGLSFAAPLIENSASERDTFTSLEWLAGWVALHDLGQNAEAISHFENFTNAAKFAPTRSRGLFWAGRAAEAADDPRAQSFYTRAARYERTFYGQLAHERAGLTYALTGNDLPSISPDTRAAFAENRLVEAAELYRARGDEDLQRLFLQTAADRADRETLRLIAELANRTGKERIAVLSTRGSDTTGPDGIVALSYPRIDVPEGSARHWINIHGLARQESQFESDSISHAGARGLMQLMPATAQEQARKEGLGYNFSGLISDPDYNLVLGSRYFEDMVNYWDGSIVLAVASYNAGPGNVRRWVREHGDPRDASVDVLKWIEEIPFFETKTYVRNVLSNFVVYEQLEPEYRRGGPETERLTWYLARGARQG
ncbi:MAG: transglycosylase SLT domain-containing protein [Pacificimonas sp.]|jgi:soluble lytic murein transglycosylase|nr:transglycosylase SLT domain-containing protein [Pacificimonas sp.]